MTAQFNLIVVRHKSTFGAFRRSGARRSSNAIPSGYEREGNRKLLTLRKLANLAITGLFMATTAGKLRFAVSRRSGERRSPESAPSWCGWEGNNRASLAKINRPRLPERIAGAMSEVQNHSAINNARNDSARRRPDFIFCSSAPAGASSLIQVTHGNIRQTI